MDGSTDGSSISNNDSSMGPASATEVLDSGCESADSIDYAWSTCSDTTIDSGSGEDYMYSSPVPIDQGGSLQASGAGDPHAQWCGFDDETDYPPPDWDWNGDMDMDSGLSDDHPLAPGMSDVDGPPADAFAYSVDSDSDAQSETTVTSEVEEDWKGFTVPGFLESQRSSVKQESAAVTPPGSDVAEGAGEMLRPSDELQAVDLPQSCYNEILPFRLSASYQLSRHMIFLGGKDGQSKTYCYAIAAMPQHHHEICIRGDALAYISGLRLIFSGASWPSSQYSTVAQSSPGRWVLPSVEADGSRCWIYFCINGWPAGATGRLGCKLAGEEWDSPMPLVGKGTEAVGRGNACPLCLQVTAKLKPLARRFSGVEGGTIKCCATCVETYRRHHAGRGNSKRQTECHPESQCFTCSKIQTFAPTETSASPAATIKRERAEMLPVAHAQPVKKQRSAAAKGAVVFGLFALFGLVYERGWAGGAQSVSSDHHRQQNVVCTATAHVPGARNATGCRGRPGHECQFACFAPLVRSQHFPHVCSPDGMFRGGSCDVPPGYFDTVEWLSTQTKHPLGWPNLSPGGGPTFLDLHSKVTLQTPLAIKNVCSQHVSAPCSGDVAVQRSEPSRDLQRDHHAVEPPGQRACQLVARR